jgi:hypothetical protein
MGITHNSKSNILHKVLDMWVVLPYCLDLLACYPCGMGISEGNLDVNDVPPPLEDMTRNIRFG